MSHRIWDAREFSLDLGDAMIVIEFAGILMALHLFEEP
jgi:hypothetical protein